MAEGKNLETMDIEALIETIGNGSRRQRQVAAESLNKAASDDVSTLVPYAKDIIAALDVPEGKTRWNLIEVLTKMIPCGVKQIDKAIPDIENSIYDDENGMARLTAFVFMCTYGAESRAHSKKVWPIIKESFQVCHGDPEFNDMLNSLASFASGKIGQTVKVELKDLLKFDAEANKGVVAKKAAKIIESLS
jgi:hypothetical protein